MQGCDAMGDPWEEFSPHSLAGASLTSPSSYEPFEDDTNERVLRSISGLYAGQRGYPNTQRLRSPLGQGSSPASPNRRRSRGFRAADEGLKALCDDLGVHCDWPRRKLTVMIVGNHSAGKSTFINWYIGDHVQKVGAAVETRNFTVVTCGKRRETLGGPAALQLFDDLACLVPLGGESHVCAEVSPSRARHFPLITFIDTPGLADGAHEYPYPVEDCVVELGKMCDVVLFFFDPNMQALCDRTLDVARRLSVALPSDRVKYLLSKADTVRSGADRHKVLVQLTQALATLVTTPLRDLPCLYVPGAEAAGAAPDALPASPAASVHSAASGSLTVHAGTNSPPPNYIYELCADLEKAVRHNVQAALDRAQRDALELETAAAAALTKDATARVHNRRVARGSATMLLLSLVGPTALVAYTLSRTGWGAGRYPAVDLVRESVVGAVESDDRLLHALCVGATVSLVALHLLAQWTRRSFHTQLALARATRLEQTLTFAREVVKPQVASLYDDYLSQSINFDFM